MGYYTRYSLTLQDAEPDVSANIIAELRTEYEEAQWALNEDGTSRDESTWYAFRNDLCTFSRRHPDYFFELQIEPANPDDGKGASMMVFRDGEVVDSFKL